MDERDVVRDLVAKLMEAVEAVCEKKVFTPDLGGKARTKDVTAAVLDALK